MIPKVIHYCWFGGNPLPELAQKCIASWKKYCPDYEIIEWNESNFDFSECSYAKEAYEARKWAFVSDFARFKILYENGGLYFDTDVELIKSIDYVVTQGDFMSCEPNGEYLLVATGLGMALEAGNDICHEIMLSYYNDSFVKDNIRENKTVVIRVTEIMKKYGFDSKSKAIQNIKGINIFPEDFFCPLNLETGLLNITGNTVSIHHYDGSWLPEEERKAKKYTHEFLLKGFSHKVSHRLALMKAFTEKYGIIKMPVKLIRYKQQNMKAKNKAVDLKKSDNIF